MQSSHVERLAAPTGLDDDVAIQHRSFVVGSVFCSISFLEATVNELFSDAADITHKSTHINQLGEDAQKLLASLWETEIYSRNARVLEKFQDMLRLNGKRLFEKDRPPYQDVDSLTKLRNSLIHYKPEWIPATTGKIDQALLHDLEKRLRGKFNTNPFVEKGTPFFPHGCLSHGCAEWATRTSMSFTDKFFDRMDMTNPLDSIRAKLQTR